MRSRLFKTAALTPAIAAMLGMTTPAFTEPTPYRPSVAPPGAPLAVQQVSDVRSQVLNLPKGRSAVIDLPVDASDVFVSNPAVADAVLRTPRRIFVLGVSAGESDAIFFDRMGRQILNLSIRVDAPTDQLGAAVERLFPNARVDIQSLNGRVILSGMAENAGQADQIFRLAQTFVEKPEDVINLMSVAGKDQVTLKVQIVEVNRSTIKQLGLTANTTYNFGTQSYSFGRANTFGTNGNSLASQGLCYGQNSARTTDVSNTVTGNTDTSTTSGTSTGTSSTATNTSSGNITTSQVTSVNADGSAAVTVNGVTGLGGTGPGFENVDTTTSETTGGTSSTIGNVINNVATTAYKSVIGNTTGACLQAFERVGLARTLAEPNLTAVSGESAKFLAGGEFPVPVGQDNQGRITVEFKPFGVGLGFTPVVMSEGRISIRISTEVSELTNVGSLQLNDTLNIPGLTVRRAETTVEMPSGSSFMIAGLLQSKYKQSIDSMPGLTTLPVLGSLFRSRDFLNDETELVVIVTPYIVSPVDPNAIQTPADNLQIASDLETVMLGRLNRVVKERNGAPPPPEGAPVPYQAPIGYVIE